MGLPNRMYPFPVKAPLCSVRGRYSSSSNTHRVDRAARANATWAPTVAIALVPVGCTTTGSSVVVIVFVCRQKHFRRIGLFHDTVAVRMQRANVTACARHDSPPRGRHPRVSRAAGWLRVGVLE